MAAPMFSDVRSRIDTLTELIQQLETAEDNIRKLSNEKARRTATNCLEVPLKTLREHRSKVEEDLAR